MKYCAVRNNLGFIVSAKRVFVLVVFSAVAALSYSLADIKVVEAPEIGKTSRALVEGASLKTDAEVNELLARADQFASQGRYDLAAKLWQTVIDSSNDLMFTRDEWVEKTLEHEYQRYRSVSRDIESTIASLPKEGKEGYRLKADAEAKLVMERPSGSDGESALAEVVRRYFISSHGDDAAFELACLKLDRYEFLPAIRLLDKIINDYPTPSIDKDQVLLRLAALNARVGDTARAIKIIKDLKSRVTPAVADELIDLVEADIQRSGRPATNFIRADKVWPMSMGGAGRRGVMLHPERLPLKSAAPAWIQSYDLKLPESWPDLPADTDKAVALNVDDPFGRGLGRSSTSRKPSTPKAMNESWLKHGWIPSARVLFEFGNVYFKTHNRLVCADAQSGELRWLGFRNDYPSRAASYYNRTTADVIGRAPVDNNEISNFADSIHQSMCIVGDKLLTLQGIPVDFTEERAVAANQPVDPMLRRRMMINRATTGVSRMRENRLVAYHARNGKLQWMRSANEPGIEMVKKSCFAGPPVPYAGFVLVPVLEGNGMYLVALDSESGVTQWRTFLGDEPSSGSAQNGSVVISVDGGEAYVATGAGLLFSVDAISGSMNWAVSYPRTTESDPARDRQLQRFGAWGARGAVRFDGWHEEMIIPSGNVVIVTPTDFNHLIAFDRRSGSLLWESARSPRGGQNKGLYALGVKDGCVYVAGRGVVRCYKVNGGRLIWEKLYPPGYGRGALTDGGILMTSGQNKILLLSLDDGKQVSTIDVETLEQQPLGNLYSNGSMLFSAGLRKVFAIGEFIPSEESDDHVPEAKVLDDVVEDIDELIAESFSRMVAAYQRGVSDFSGLAERFEVLAKELELVPLPDSARRGEILSKRAIWFSGQQASLERAKLNFSRLGIAKEKKEDAISAIENFRTKLIPMKKLYGSYGIEIP